MSKTVKRSSKTPVVPTETVAPTEPETVAPTETIVTEGEEVSVKDQLDALIALRNEDIRRLREEINGLKRLCKQYTTERKNATKRRKRPVDPNAPKRQSGFAKPSIVSDAMYKFLGVEKGSLISRTDVTKKIFSYISDNNLKNPEAKREFFPDKKLKALLGEPLQFRDNDETKGKMYSTMGVQTYIKYHFVSSKTAK